MRPMLFDVDPSSERRFAMVRAGLYLLGGILTAIPSVIDTTPRSLTVPLLAVGGLLTAAYRIVRQSNGALVTVTAYDLLASVVLGAIGAPLLGMVVVFASTAGVAMLRPHWSIRAALAAGVATGALTALAVTTGGLAEMAPLGGGTAGVAVLAGSLGIITFAIAAAIGHIANTLRNTEAALAHERRRLDLFFERLPVGLYRSTPDGRVVAANQAMADILGVPEPAALVEGGIPVNTAYADPDARQAWVARFDDEDVVLEADLELERPDGTVVRVTDSAAAVRDDDGTILFFEGVVHDVTEHKEAEEARARLVEIIEASSDLIFLLSHDARLVRGNAAVFEFLGGDDPVGTPISRFIRPLHDADSLQAWHEAGIDIPWSGEIAMVGGAGREVLTSAVAQRHGTSWSVIARDITAERSTARQLRESLAAKDEFVASVSHELRTPLTVVVGLAAELDRAWDTFDDVTRREFIRLIAEQSSDVAGIVEDLLVAARADSDTMTFLEAPVDLRSAVESVIETVPEDRRAGFRVEGGGVALGDPQRTRQIVRNLVTNVLRYGETPATIRIARDPLCDLLLVQVTDSGGGVPPELVERIFMPFERGERGHAGQPNSVGLGLSVSRWLAERMGGTLTYDDVDETTFSLRMPAAQ